MAVKLNIGAGKTCLEGYTPIDIADGQDARKLEYEDASVDEIRASHVLEHFPHTQTLAVLREWARVLKPEGVMQLSVPDAAKLMPEFVSGAQAPAEWCLMGGQVNAHDFHYAVFTRGKIEHLMRAVGLRNIQAWPGDQRDSSSLPISLNLEGTKRRRVATDEEIARDVTAIMTKPRITFSENADAILNSIGRMRIPLRQGGTVFWGQGMTKAIEGALEYNAPRYLLTIDYDTPFTPEDVRELYLLMEEHQEIDAICAMQMQRDSKFALFSKTNEHGELVGDVRKLELEKDLMPIFTGHFGLTILRADCFRSLPTPWFCGKPDGKGRWEECWPIAPDGKQDDDVWFWRQWKEAGLNLYSANKVVVGHLQLMVTWPDKDLRPLMQSLGSYHQNGKPPGAL